MTRILVMLLRRFVLFLLELLPGPKLVLSDANPGSRSTSIEGFVVHDRYESIRKKFKDLVILADSTLRRINDRALFEAITDASADAFGVLNFPLNVKGSRTLFDRWSYMAGTNILRLKSTIYKKDDLRNLLLLTEKDIEDRQRALSKIRTAYKQIKNKDDRVGYDFSKDRFIPRW